MMRLSYSLSLLAAAALLAACDEHNVPTSQRYSGGMAAARGARDTTGLPSQYSANGATALVSWYASLPGDSAGGGGYLNGYISVNRVGSQTNEWTEVYWYIYSCSIGCTYSNGFGNMPGDVLSGSGGGNLRLKFDPAAYPGAFYVYGDPLGPVDLTWSPNGMYSQRITGTSEYQYPGFRYQSNGVSESAQAAVTGSVNGTVLSGAWGQMGTNHSVTIQFYR